MTAAVRAAIPISSWMRDDFPAQALTALVCMLLVLMIVPDGFDYSMLSAGVPTSGSAATRLMWLFLLGAGALAVVRRPLLGGMVLGQLNAFLPAFVVLALASVAWSIEPQLTLRRDLRLATILLVTLAFSLGGWHPRRLQAVLRPAFTLLLAGSLAFGVLFPQYAIHSEASPELLNAWRGLTSHKNGFGAVSCIALLLWLHAWLDREVSWPAGAAGTALAVLCLVLSRSSTSLIAAVFVSLLLLLLLRVPERLRRYVPAATGLFVLVLLAYSLAILRLVPGLDILLSPVTALTGKDLSFTGRSEIWALIAEHIREAPLLGTGYGAYWSQHPGSPSMALVERLYFFPDSSHNGYLDVTNDLGFAGLALLIGYIGVYAHQALRLLPLERGQAALFLALFMQQALANLSESHWLSVTSVNFVVMTLATVALARCRLEQNFYARFGRPVVVRPATAATALSEEPG